MPDDKIYEIKRENPIPDYITDCIKGLLKDIKSGKISAVCYAAKHVEYGVQWYSFGSNLETLGMAEYLKAQAQFEILNVVYDKKNQ